MIFDKQQIMHEISIINRESASQLQKTKHKKTKTSSKRSPLYIRSKSFLIKERNELNKRKSPELILSLVNSKFESNKKFVRKNKKNLSSSNIKQLIQKGSAKKEFFITKKKRLRIESNSDMYINLKNRLSSKECSLIKSKPGIDYYLPKTTKSKRFVSGNYLVDNLNPYTLKKQKNGYKLPPLKNFSDFDCNYKNFKTKLIQLNNSFITHTFRYPKTKVITYEYETTFYNLAAFKLAKLIILSSQWKYISSVVNYKKKRKYKKLENYNNPFVYRFFRPEKKKITQSSLSVRPTKNSHKRKSGKKHRRVRSRRIEVSSQWMMIINSLINTPLTRVNSIGYYDIVLPIELKFSKVYNPGENETITDKLELICFNIREDIRQDAKNNNLVFNV